MIKKLTSSFNWNPNSLSDFELEDNLHPNLMESESKSLTIGFVGPNCLSLGDCAYKAERVHCLNCLYFSNYLMKKSILQTKTS